MQVGISSGPAFAFGTVAVGPGAEREGRGGRDGRDDRATCTIETQGDGRVCSEGSKRSVLGGESFFINTFRRPMPAATWPSRRSCPAIIAPPVRSTGAHVVRAVGVVRLAVRTRASTSTRSGAAAKTFFGGEGLFLLKCSGAGDVLVSSYGAILERRIDAGESYVIDTGHVVAFPEGMRYGVEKAGSWKSTVFGAEGLVVRFEGPGSVWLQTRSPQDLIGWVNQHIPHDRWSTNSGSEAEGGARFQGRRRSVACPGAGGRPIEPMILGALRAKGPSPLPSRLGRRFDALLVRGEVWPAMTELGIIAAVICCGLSASSGSSTAIRRSNRRREQGVPAR